MVDMNMSDTLISFETAKLAKEKGFTHQTGTLHPNGSYYNFRGELNGCCLESLREMHIPKKDRMYSVLPAPTQSLLQKWLREEHTILVDILSCYREEDLPLSLNNFAKPESYFAWDFYDPYFTEEKAKKFNTYEEALEEGLKDALNLIK